MKKINLNKQGLNKERKLKGKIVVFIFVPIISSCASFFPSNTSLLPSDPVIFPKPLEVAGIKRQLFEKIHEFWL